MRLVNKTQRIGRVIAKEQRRVYVALSTTMGILLDLLEASLGMSSRRTGTNHPTPVWHTMFEHKHDSRNRIYANFRPAYVINQCGVSTARFGR